MVLNNAKNVDFLVPRDNTTAQSSGQDAKGSRRVPQGSWWGVIAFLLRFKSKVRTTLRNRRGGDGISLKSPIVKKSFEFIRGNSLRSKGAVSHITVGSGSCRRQSRLQNSEDAWYRKSFNKPPGLRVVNNSSTLHKWRSFLYLKLIIFNFYFNLFFSSLSRGLSSSRFEGAYSMKGRVLISRMGLIRGFTVDHLGQVRDKV